MHRIFGPPPARSLRAERFVAGGFGVVAVGDSMGTSANCRLVARLPRTAFQKGTSGNPRGRARGTRNKATVEAREFAARLIEDPEYGERLRLRLLEGTAGPVEMLLWHYAWGRPMARVEVGTTNPFAAVSDAELRAKLESVLAKISHAEPLR